MRVTILKSFPYAADGLHAVRLDAGSEADVHDELVPGLEKEGWVRPAFELVKKLTEGETIERAIANPVRNGRKRS